MSVRAWKSLLASVCAASVLAPCNSEYVTGATGPGTATTARTPFPTLPNRGGHVLSSLRLVVVVAANDNLRDSLFTFADAILASAWWREVAGAYGVASAAGALKVTGAPLFGVNLASSQLQDYVRSAIAAPATLAPNGRTLYLLYLPGGVSFAGNAACSLASGYHSAFGNAGDAWAVVQRCQSVYRSVLEELTVVGSHEVIEATTDPLGDAWGLPGVVTAFVAGHGPSNGAPSLTLRGTDSTSVGGRAYPTLNDRGVLALGVTFPPGSPPGSYATITVQSFRFDAFGQRPPPGEDYLHAWAVGVWVPSGATSSAR